MDHRSRKIAPILHYFSILFIAGLLSFWGLEFENTFAHVMKLPDACGIYCKMSMNYFDYLRERAFDPYYFSKSLPAFVAAIFQYIFFIANANTISSLSVSPTS